MFWREATMIMFSSEELRLPGVFMISHLNSVLQNQHVNRYARPATVGSPLKRVRQSSTSCRYRGYSCWTTRIGEWRRTAAKRQSEPPRRKSGRETLDRYVDGSVLTRRRLPSPRRTRVQNDDGGSGRVDGRRRRAIAKTKIESGWKRTNAADYRLLNYKASWVIITIIIIIIRRTRYPLRGLDSGPDNNTITLIITDKWRSRRAYAGAASCCACLVRR